MAFDAFFLKAVLDELRPRLIGGRIEKIHQPARDTVLLLIKGTQGREKLLFALNPTAPRIHLTQSSPENPPEPPMFCMLLRKHLSGGRLLDIYQPAMERMAVLTFSCVDEMGDTVEKKLVAELMGRTCNLYLLGSDGRIIDCLRRIGVDESKRPALPGLFYQQPQQVEKADPTGLEAADFMKILAAPGADLLSQRLMGTLGGLSPLVCREAALFAGGDTDCRPQPPYDALAERLSLFFKTHLHQSAPYYYADSQGNMKQFAFCPIYQYGENRQAESFTALLDEYYIVRDRKDAMRQKGQAVRKTVQNLISRVRRKLAIQEKELTATYDRERLRQLGDILTANIYAIKKGQQTVDCVDFYDEDMKTVTIPISPLLSPQQNAAKYYKDYGRMKNAEKELTQQIKLGGQELLYLESVLEELDRACTDAELEEIKRELQDGGYIRGDSSKKRMKQSKLPPMRFESTDGYFIYVGRNNRQNDELTFKAARKDDLWCHASKVHGSHVIISCQGTPPPDNTITQAAQLAAYYSGAIGGQNIAVDVTAVKQVKKTPGAKPGMVIYHTYRTVIANPYPDIVVDELNAEKKPSDE